jgi:CheY-like chemotaxis protein
VPRILLAEGHGPTCEFVSRTLTDAGLETLAAEDADAAYELYAARRPEVVVIATDFAGGEGDALARRLREADPRVLLIVSDREHLGKARGLHATLSFKANAYVADPTGPELVAKIQQLVAQSAPARGRLRGTALVLDRAPSARGDIRPGVVARLLHQIWRGVSDGVLALEEAGRERRVFFRRGVPVACQSDDPADSLARWLVDSGRMNGAAHQAALEAMASGLSPGAALIAAGVLEPGEALQTTLAAHLRATVVRSVGARQGRWRFHVGTEFASEVQAVEILPLQPILEGARAHVPVKHFADALKAVVAAYPVRTGDFQQLLPAAGLASADLRRSLAIDGRSSTREFLDAHRSDLKDALSLLWFLSMLGAVAFHEVPEQANAYGKTPSRKPKPLPVDRAEAVRHAALQILPGTYFHALGVDIAADAAEVERAYQAVASRFHPDGFAEYEVGDLADLLTAVQDKVTAAYRVLSNEEKRRAYLSFLLLRFEAAGARRPGINVEAEVALKRGERALRERRMADALAALREAVDLNGREPEYTAMLAFAELFDPSATDAERAARARRTAKKALAMAPEHPRAAVALALAERRLGNPAEARRVLLDALNVHGASDLLKQALRLLHSTSV